MLNVYDGAFLQKSLTIFSYVIYSLLKLTHKNSL